MDGARTKLPVEFGQVVLPVIMFIEYMKKWLQLRFLLKFCLNHDFGYLNK